MCCCWTAALLLSSFFLFIYFTSLFVWISFVYYFVLLQHRNLILQYFFCCWFCCFSLCLSPFRVPHACTYSPAGMHFVAQITTLYTCATQRLLHEVLLWIAFVESGNYWNFQLTSLLLICTNDLLQLHCVFLPAICLYATAESNAED